jgi:hypothetical protein
MPAFAYAGSFERQTQDGQGVKRPALCAFDVDPIVVRQHRGTIVIVNPGLSCSLPLSIEQRMRFG